MVYVIHRSSALVVVSVVSVVDLTGLERFAWFCFSASSRIARGPIVEEPCQFTPAL